MPAFRNVRRSRRLSHQPPTGEWFFDLECLQYPTDVDAQPLPPADTPPLDPCSPGQASTSSASSPPTPPALLHQQVSQNKRKDGHIPRPPNAFMLYRSAFWAKQKETGCVERDHRQISRIAAHCWNDLSDVDRQPYRQRAQQLKVEHGRRHPEYKYSPASRKEKATKKKVKRDSGEENERCKALAALVMKGVQGSELQQAVTSMDEKFEESALRKLEARKTRDEEGDGEFSLPKPRSRRRLPKKEPQVKIEALPTPELNTNPSSDYVHFSDIPPLEESTMSEPLISPEAFFKQELFNHQFDCDYTVVAKPEPANPEVAAEAGPSFFDVSHPPIGHQFDVDYTPVVKSEPTKSKAGPSFVDVHALTNYYETNGDYHTPILYTPAPDPYTITENNPGYPGSDMYFNYDASLYVEKQDFGLFERVKMEQEVKLEIKEWDDWINYDPNEPTGF